MTKSVTTTSEASVVRTGHRRISSSSSSSSCYSSSISGSSAGVVTSSSLSPSSFSLSSSSSSSLPRMRGATRRLLILSIALVVLPDLVDMRRWMTPCGGSTTVESGGVPDAASSGAQELRRSYHRLSEKSSGLKRKVRDLKQLYVAHRFRDAELVEDMERIGLRLEGMPTLEEATAGSIANIDAGQTIHKAFERLAKVSVFLDQARIGETLSTSEHISFDASIQHLEDNAEYGLYWLLCELYRLIVVSRQSVDPGVVRAILAIRVVDVDSNSMRHTRDYIVLRDLEKILDQISIDFASLHLQQQALAALRR